MISPSPGTSSSASTRTTSPCGASADDFAQFVARRTPSLRRAGAPSSFFAVSLRRALRSVAA